MNILLDAFWSAVAATGFALLFNVPRRALFGCAVSGATGHAIRTLMMTAFGLPIEVATLFGATAVGFLGVRLARYYLAPSLVFSVTGAIPLVPGLFAYSAMLGVIELVANEQASMVVLLDTVQNAIRTGMILGAIALGIIMPKLLFKRMKPVV